MEVWFPMYQSWHEWVKYRLSPRFQMSKTKSKNWKFQNFPKNSPRDVRKEDACQVSNESEVWKYGLWCTKVGKSSVGKKKKEDKTFGSKWQFWALYKFRTKDFRHALNSYRFLYPRYFHIRKSISVGPFTDSEHRPENTDLDVFSLSRIIVQLLLRGLF